MHDFFGLFLQVQRTSKCELLKAVAVGRGRLEQPPGAHLLSCKLFVNHLPYYLFFARQL